MFLRDKTTVGHGGKIRIDPGRSAYGEKNVGRRSTSFAQQLLDDATLPSLLSQAACLCSVTPSVTRFRFQCYGLRRNGLSMR